ncbi:MAG: DNA repair protein RadC [Sphingobacteriia bacterium]|nr:DNA repair protein RadC [Sphingobacteriia bacterium]
MADENKHYLGHRKRVRERLMNSRPGTIPDYELLEMILFLSKPRGDVKPLAKELIKIFGSITRVLCATPNQLMTIKGIGESTIASLKLMHEVAARMQKEEIITKPIIESWSALLEYARLTMGHISTEQFRVLYLNKKNMVITDELQETGTVDHTPVYPRELIKRAVTLDATAMILIHNHPSGNCKPSKTDIIMTEEINKLCSSLGIKLYDHLIVSNNYHFSFKNSGII